MPLTLLSLPPELRLELLPHLPSEADLQSLRLSSRHFYILIPPPRTTYNPDTAILPINIVIRDWRDPSQHVDFLHRLLRDLPPEERGKWRVCTHCKHIKRKEEFVVDEVEMEGWLSELEEGEERRGDWCGVCHGVGGVLGRVKSREVRPTEERRRRMEGGDGVADTPRRVSVDVFLWGDDADAVVRVPTEARTEPPPFNRDLSLFLFFVAAWVAFAGMASCAVAAAARLLRSTVFVNPAC